MPLSREAEESVRKREEARRSGIRLQARYAAGKHQVVLMLSLASSQSPPKSISSFQIDAQCTTTSGNICIKSVRCDGL
jgi:hypothetical protein